MSNLQSKLEAIKEFKAQYHIGSQAALRLLQDKNANLRLNQVFGGIDGLYFLNIKNDNLYERLEREQILHRDDMQKLYLARWIEMYKIDRIVSNSTNLDELSKFINELMNDAEEHRREFREVESEEELEWLKLISRRHKNWLIKYLQS